MPETEKRSAVDALAIRRRDSLSAEQEQQILAAGYNLDRILADEGIAAEALHDAMFLTEDIARTTLGTNYERIIASSEQYNDTIAILRPSRVVDFGGGCGITCFDAAGTWRNCEFIVCDRSRNALEIGLRWAKRLNLTNVSFRRLDFTDSNLESVLGADNDLIVFEYIFTLSSKHEDETDVIARVSPGMKTATRLLSSTGKVCVRFGEFSEQGLGGLIRATYRVGLFVYSIAATAKGCTFVFTRDDCEDSEDAEVFRAIDEFGCQFRAIDSGE